MFGSVVSWVEAPSVTLMAYRGREGVSSQIRYWSSGVKLVISKGKARRPTSGRELRNGPVL
jgi:hypothetical protein